MNATTKRARTRALIAARRWLNDLEFLEMDASVREFHVAQARADLSRAEQRYLEAFRGSPLPHDDTVALTAKE
jgi:hypothetical protein